MLYCRLRNICAGISKAKLKACLLPQSTIWNTHMEAGWWAENIEAVAGFSTCFSPTEENCWYLCEKGKEDIPLCAALSSPCWPGGNPSSCTPNCGLLEALYMKHSKSRHNKFVLYKHRRYLEIYRMFHCVCAPVKIILICLQLNSQKQLSVVREWQALWDWGVKTTSQTYKATGNETWGCWGDSEYHSPSQLSEKEHLTQFALCAEKEGRKVCDLYQ